MKTKRIIGASGFLAEILYINICRTEPDVEIVAFAEYPEFIENDTAYGLPLLSYETAFRKYPGIEYYVAVGSNRVNQSRKETYDMIIENNGKPVSYFHPSVVDYTLGKGIATIAFANVILDAKCRIGDGNVFLSNAILSHHSSAGDFNFFAPGCVILGKTEVGNYNFFGANSCVKNLIKVGNSILVGANAYLDKSVPDESIVVPARSVILNKKSTDYRHF